MVYELGASASHSSDPTIKNCLFGAMQSITLTKNPDIEKCKYSGYGTDYIRAYVDQTKLFVILNKHGIKINVDVIVKN